MSIVSEPAPPAGPAVAAQGAGSGEQVVLATPMQLAWWRFRKHKLAVGAAVVLALFYLAALLAPFLAVAEPTRAEAQRSLMPPMNILNAPTRLMKQVGYGKGYEYDHEADEGFSGANYWPEEMTPQRFYEPTGRGFEAKVAERLAYWEEKRRERCNTD